MVAVTEHGKRGQTRGCTQAPHMSASGVICTPDSALDPVDVERLAEL